MNGFEARRIHETGGAADQPAPFKGQIRYGLQSTSRQRAFTMNPIWPYLKAVRTGQVYEVPHYWKEGAGPIARERILDDIQRLLLTSEPDK